MQAFQVYGNNFEGAVRRLGNNVVATDFLVNSSREAIRMSPSADAAQGTTEEFKVSVSFAYQSDKTQGRYKNYRISLDVFKRRGRWCICWLRGCHQSLDSGRLSNQSQGLVANEGQRAKT